jgi:superfamily II DNA/RNA helicase
LKDKIDAVLLAIIVSQLISKMPRIFDNIELSFLPTLQESLRTAERADFCVGYFNLRGWKEIAGHIDNWKGGVENSCRLMVGMQSAPQEELRKFFSLANKQELDQATVVRLKKQIAQDFKEQLTFGIPTAEDEKALRQLSEQIKAKKVVVKLFLKHQLHAKLYLVHRNDHNNPTIGFVGSSNLTFAGLSKQGELNVDVLDGTACEKLQKWFVDRWDDRWCLDISDELAEIIDTSWARKDLIPPYHIYLKIAYHLSQEARAGVTEFRIPREFQNILFDFQKAAVQIAARHLKKRNGVLIGDVVGLGKTLMATALAKLVEQDTGHSTLIICPKNLVKMWESYKRTYGLQAEVLSLSKVIKELDKIPARFRTVLIDESHNLRNREGKRYKVIQEFIRQSDSRCILLSATPYNKSYLDLSAQLRLFIPDDKDIGVRPEKLLQDEDARNALIWNQTQIRTLSAFEKSPYPDDWRDLMRLFLIRRTRSFIMDNYAKTDEANGRKYLLFPNEKRFYFPIRQPITAKFSVSEDNPNDPYEQLASEEVVSIIGSLSLPRYGLGKYVSKSAETNASSSEKEQIEGLSRAGKRLMGYSRTNLFKRLESGGMAFLLSIERHILRNYIFLYAIENKLPLPIGSQAAEYLDTTRTDEDEDELSTLFDDAEIEETEEATDSEDMLEDTEFLSEQHSNSEFKKRAAEVYQTYQTTFQKRFKWINSKLFKPSLGRELKEDAENLSKLLKISGKWSIDRDSKFARLLKLLQSDHPTEKILVFTQFADTAKFLERELRKKGVTQIAYATGSSADPTELAWRFSPKSNDKTTSPEKELRVLIATDVLSEGQNLQDAHIVVNYDLPWAIIRLIQRAGRVDRIGQNAERILCYSFLPSKGVDKIIKLRERVKQRLKENAEVVGTDEAFFEDEFQNETLLDLYHEKAGLLDDEKDSEVDLASQAFQIWKNATDQNPKLKRIIEDLSKLSYSTREFQPTNNLPEGVLVYVRTAEDTDALAWIDKQGKNVTESQLAILQMAQCHPDTPAIPRHPKHFELVGKGVEQIVQEERLTAGSLGRPSGARYKVFNRLKSYLDEARGTLFEVLPESKNLAQAVDDIYRFPLKQTATDLLNKKIRESIGNHELAELVISLRDQDTLSQKDEEAEFHEPQIICSLGLFAKEED